MASTNFVDYVKTFCRSGAGGRGSAHLHRDKRTMKGGPDGGDGGRGGNVIVRGNRNYWTLIHLKYQRHVFAGDGGNGSEDRSTGADGEDVTIEVPLGTVARDAETGETICEITQDGESFILVKGGRGGLGNWNFRSATNQTPRFAQPGEPRVERTVILELKVLADVGLVGFPNAGKSTLLSVVSAAKPEIANYPFTTLVPNLGIVNYRDGRSFVMADIPGIIEGAHQGKGLGIRFLRHIERNSVLLFLVPADSQNIHQEYNILLNELKQYNPELLDKKRVLAISKSDCADKELMAEMECDLPDLFIPYPLEYLVGAEHPIPVGRQQIQNIKFNRRKGNLLPVLLYHMGGLIDRKVLNLDLFLLIRCRFLLRLDRCVTLHLGLHPRQKLQRMERFCQIIVGPCSESHDLIHILRLGRQNQNRNIAGLANRAAHLKSVDARHHNIKDQHPDLRMFRQHGKTLLAIRSLQYFISVVDQINLHQIRDFFIIIHY